MDAFTGHVRQQQQPRIPQNCQWMVLHFLVTQQQHWVFHRLKMLQLWPQSKQANPAAAQAWVQSQWRWRMVPLPPLGRLLRSPQRSQQGNWLSIMMKKLQQLLPWKRTQLLPLLWEVEREILYQHFSFSSWLHLMGLSHKGLKWEGN